MQIPLGIESYEIESLPLSAQRLVNLFPETAPETAKTPIAFFATPGLEQIATVGSGPFRGSWKMGNIYYAVSGNNLYSVSSSYVVTDLGEITPTTRVSFADNGTQLMICCGPEGYIYDTVNGLQRILDVDTDYPGGNQAAFLDGFFLVNRPGTDEFWISAAYDGLSWNALDFATAEGKPDQLVGLIVDHREAWLFGEETTEIWYNSGGSDFTFARLSNVFIERGLAAAASPARQDNTIYWLGDDRIVYMANNYTPIKISNFAMERDIRDYSSVADAYAYCYTESGHKFYVLTFPTQCRTWAFDAATGKWHERAYGDDERHRAACYTRIWDKDIVGDYKRGRLYRMSHDYLDDDGTAIQRIIHTGVVQPGDESKFSLTKLQLVLEQGEGGDDDEVKMEQSKDGGKTWGFARTRSLSSTNNRARCIWYKLGKARERIFRFTISAATKVVIYACHGS